MPFVRDKIIIDSGDFTGDCAKIRGKQDAILFAYNTAERFAAEIQDRGLLTQPQAMKFLSRQEEQCAGLRELNAEYETNLERTLQVEREIANDMRLWLDRQPVPTNGARSARKVNGAKAARKVVARKK